jgi:hypothetical protein
LLPVWSQDLASAHSTSAVQLRCAVALYHNLSDRCFPSELSFPPLVAVPALQAVPCCRDPPHAPSATARMLQAASTAATPGGGPARPVLHLWCPTLTRLHAR